jgi:LysM repeat protein
VAGSRFGGSVADSATKQVGRTLARLALALGCVTALAGCSRGSPDATPTPASSELFTIVTEAPITPEQRPASASQDEVTYVIREGDTLSGIATQFGVSVEQLLELNDILDPDSIRVGQEIRVPQRGD